MSSRRTSSVPKEDVVFPRMLYCDSRCSQTLPGLLPALPGALLDNATRRLGDGKCVILRQRVRGSVRAVKAVRNTLVFQTETSVVADIVVQNDNPDLRPVSSKKNIRGISSTPTNTLRVSNGWKFLGEFRIRFHPKLGCSNGSYHTKNPDYCKWVSFTTQNSVFQVPNVVSN
jgi:hypothetical protein